MPESSDGLEIRLSKAKVGDAEAFAGIYDQFAGKIYSFAYRMTGLREDAEDVTQDTFFRAYRSLGDLRDPLHFEQWLYRIARNEIYKKHKKARRRPESLDEAESGTAQALLPRDPSGDPETKLLGRELGSKLRAVLDSLPMRYRETLVLATLQGLSYQEICRILGRNLSSVKTDVYRARIMISEKMRKYQGM